MRGSVPAAAYDRRVTTAGGKGGGQAGDGASGEPPVAGEALAWEVRAADEVAEADEASAARADLPWSGRPRPADLFCWSGIALSGLYALALYPMRPLLIGGHPVLLELLTGSMTSIVTAGAFARVGQVPLLLALVVVLVFERSQFGRATN